MKIVFDLLEMKQAFVLVSTAYVETTEIGKLEERHYESAIRPEILKSLIENIDEDQLDALTPKYFHCKCRNY